MRRLFHPLDVALGIYGSMLLFLIAVLVGWVMNIVTIIGIEELTFTGANVLRIVGIFLPPLGAVMGWFF